MVKVKTINCEKKIHHGTIIMIPKKKDYIINIIELDECDDIILIETLNLIKINIEIKNIIINDKIDIDKYIIKKDNLYEIKLDNNISNIEIKSLTNKLNQNIEEIIIKRKKIKSSNNDIIKINDNVKLEINLIIDKIKNIVEINSNYNKNEKYYIDFENNYINEFVKKKKKYNYLINEINRKKIIIIMAIHTNDYLKYITVINNFNYLKKYEIIVINSTNTKFGNKIKIYFELNKIIYMEIENDSKADFGKWIYVINNTDLNKFNNIIFINDSILISNYIDFYFNLVIEKNNDLYGYNDSTETEKYHYQSYLFSIKTSAINKLIEYYNNVKNNLNSWSDLITIMELNLIKLYDNHDCFLKIGYLKNHFGKNINFSNDFLFNKLLKYDLLPIFKIKRINNYL
jgi:hypothetical protein